MRAAPAIDGRTDTPSSEASAPGRPLSVGRPGRGALQASRGRMTTDVALEILGAQEIECLHCLGVGKVKDYVKWVSNRAGLTIVHCDCPTCRGLFRRIIIP